MTMGTIIGFDGEQGLIEISSGEFIDAHCIHMPRVVEPVIGMRVHCEVVREPGMPPYARAVLFVLDGDRSPATEEFREVANGLRS